MISLDDEFPYGELLVIVLYNCRSQSSLCHPVPFEGVVHPYEGEVILVDLDEFLKCDGEPSIQPLVEQVKDA